MLEFLEGETLADRLSRGRSERPALHVNEALRLAIQMADALAMAHREEAIDRDVKPGNVMLTRSGAKLLDFGLARISVPAVATSSLSMLPTTPPTHHRAGHDQGRSNIWLPSRSRAKRQTPAPRHPASP